ncbi:CRP-like cAMP-binding protein [Sphingomonas sp. PP-F2F-G114-C0414]|uniref:Crp/Fnr family transcriptional regulator n=1 Tax=Sphingomonas sp. PP-F2F-G114-C0414 TaxID=2135662 RepID=UPI000EF8E85C|nr:Crp/Fnr family transcriptional regulator [Sphingomonas sp. PP-F2F-G114-C0414]RMB26269.1 CRP-like cAMP-binding protein [Sphingomonas sp. PP-F2F-G114-C0414]
MLPPIRREYILNSSLNNIGLTIAGLSAYSAITNEDIEALMALRIKTRIFETGSYIFREGILNSDYAFSISGYSFRQKQTIGGYRQILSMIIPGDIINPENRYVSSLDYNVQCASRSLVAYASRSDFDTLLNVCGSVSLAMSLSSVADSRQLREWILNISGRSARTRVAHFLNEFAFRTKARGIGDGISFELPMSQEQIGDSVGITPAHVNRALRSFTEDGLIEQSIRSYRIINADRFRYVGEFTEGYIFGSNLNVE